MVQTIWNALLLFDLLPAGFSNRDLRTNMAALCGQPIDQFTQGRMTYQLRRLRLHGVIQRIPNTHRYRLTSFGLRVARFCTRTYARILRPGLGRVLPATSSMQCPLRRSFEKLEQEVNSWVEHANLAA
jgi:DNA-binding HxlR family transcriptional regulator